MKTSSLLGAAEALRTRAAEAARIAPLNSMVIGLLACGGMNKCESSIKRVLRETNVLMGKMLRTINDGLLVHIDIGKLNNLTHIHVESTRSNLAQITIP